MSWLISRRLSREMLAVFQERSTASNRLACLVHLTGHTCQPSIWKLSRKCPPRADACLVHPDNLVNQPTTTDSVM